MKGDLCVKKFLSIFMSLVMVVTMLPKASFAEVDTPNGHTAEECQDEDGVPENADKNQKLEGVFKYLQENFPETWKKIEPYVNSVKGWGKDYYENASEFAGKAGKLGVAVTIGLSALVVKVGWKILKFIAAWFVDEDDTQVGYYNSPCSMDRGETITYTYSTGGDQTPPNIIRLK